MTPISNPEYILSLLQAADKPLTSREIFARAMGFETADDVSKTLNYMLKKGVVEREKTGVNIYSYWPTAQQAPAPADDSGNTLLRHGGDEPMPDQSEQPLETVPASAAQQIVADALSPCVEIDATTRAMADHAEQAYEILAAALDKTPHDLCGCDLTDLATEAASQLAEWLPPPDLTQMSIAAQAVNDRITAVIDALRHAPVPFAAAIDNDNRLIGNVAKIVAELSAALTTFDRVRHLLDLPPGATYGEITAEIENVSRLADRAIQLGARDAANGPYVVITTIHSGEIADMELAREKAELVAKRSTEGHAAVAQIIASVQLAPKWSDAA